MSAIIVAPRIHCKRPVVAKKPLRRIGDGVFRIIVEMAYEMDRADKAEQAEHRILNQVADLFEEVKWISTITDEVKVAHINLDEDNLHPYITYFQTRLYHYQTTSTMTIELDVGVIGENLNRVIEMALTGDEASLGDARNFVLDGLTTLIHEAEEKHADFNRVAPLIRSEIDRAIQFVNSKAKQPSKPIAGRAGSISYRQNVLRMWMFGVFLEENPHITEENIHMAMERFYPHVVLSY